MSRSAVILNESSDDDDEDGGASLAQPRKPGCLDPIKRLFRGDDTGDYELLSVTEKDEQKKEGSAAGGEESASSRILKDFRTLRSLAPYLWPVGQIGLR